MFTDLPSTDNRTSIETCSFISRQSIRVDYSQVYLLFVWKGVLLNPLTTIVPHHTETNQLICFVNQLTGFYMMGNTGRSWVNIRVLTILIGKNCVLLNSVQEWLLGCFWPFSYVAQSVKFYTFHYQMLKSTNVWKRWFIK